MSITVTNLSKNYGAQKVVNNISFTINKGEIVGFLGPNGAGKSTTMKMITGYLQADGGTAQVCGITVHINNNETKSKIGYLPEANPLYVDMYVREYLAFVGSIHNVETSKQKIEEIINTVGLTLEANKKISQLSKGYKQRVGLAAALFHNPEVLILDEPTSGLDPNQIIEIREVIKRLGQNKTVLFSSHIMQEVEAICDRVIIINKGNIVADDTLSNLQKGNTSTQNITVGFTEDINMEWLQKLQDVTSVTTGSPFTYQLSTNNSDGVKKQLLKLAIDKNLTIQNLQSQASSSLEDVFRSLTS
jgi:ABC-2 type transport system ATP-binding protein